MTDHEKLIELTLRIAETIRDERIGDVVYACVTTMAGAVRQLDPVSRGVLEPIIDKFVEELDAVTSELNRHHDA